MPDMNGKDCFLISTSHLSDRILFRNNEDFKAAMNIVAIAAFMTGITVLDFVLMSNHVHFVVLGDYETAKRFIETFKLLLGKYLRYSRNLDAMLRGNEVDIRPIPFENESVERAVAYVQMNPVAANICTHPSQYPWGCGSLLFNGAPFSGMRKLSEYSFRNQMQLLHSRVRLPQNYLFREEGYVAPVSYVPVHYVEALFRTPKRYDYFIKSSSKAKARLEDRPSPSFSDQSLSSCVQDLCRSLFRKTGIHELSDSELSELLCQIRWRFSADIAQIARVTCTPYDKVAILLDSM